METSAIRVLVVDDDRINRMVAVQLVKRVTLPDADAPELDIAQADSGENAIEMLRSHRFDLVLMDIEMPGMTGVDATRAIRSGEAGEDKKMIPIVAMTAHNTADDERSFREAGMTDVATKPLNLARFNDLVGSILGTGR